MKKFGLISLLLLFNLSLFSQKPASKKSGIVPQEVTLISKSDSLQYSLGAFVGQWIGKNGFDISNTALFNLGMDDVLNNRSLAINDTTIAPIIAAYQLSTQNEKSRLQETKLFSSLKGKSGVGVLPNGVHYIVIKQNSGIRPVASDTITFDAIGVFPDGTVFEDSFKKNQAITNITRNLIPGLSEAVQLMPEGSVWRIFIPSSLAYGPAGLTNLIPPNTALVYEISLNKVKR